VRKLGIRQPLTALYQRISRLAWIEGQRLQPASAQGPSEGRSAELGLALALLMCASGSRQRQVIATGALGGQPRGLAEDDVEVLPVGSLPEKLKLVLTMARHGALPGLSADHQLLFFTPRQYEADGLWADVSTRPEVARLAELGVRVVPVTRLGEAAAELNALRARHLAHDHVAQAALAILLTIAAASAVWWALEERYVPMAFVPAGGAAVEAAPFQACFAAGGYYPIPLEQNGLAHSIPVGETLGWRVRVGLPPEERTGLAAWFMPDGYYVAQVMISEHSRAQVMVPQLSGTGEVKVAPGTIWEWGWQLNERIENNGLVLLAQAETPFDANALRAALIEKFPQAADDRTDGAGVDVNAAVNFVTDHAPGAATFMIQTVERSPRCNP
jgi:hypothetical protein